MPLSLNGWKGLSMVAFTVVSVISAVTAVIMKENAKQLYVTCGVLFSTEVLLAGGFVHLLFDSDEQFQELGINSFPWAFAIAGGTILCLACFELVLDRVLKKQIVSANNKENDEASLPTMAIDDITSSTFNEEAREALIPREDEEHDHDHDMHQINSDNPFSAILLTVALSIHSIIEGLGIGASGDVSEIESAFIAVICHKGFTAFALAEGMVTSGYWDDHSKRKYFYLSVGTFIFVSLLGIAIGWGISSSGEENALTAILTGVTAGSFIYVALLEILPEEMKIIKRERLSVIPTTCFFLAGFCLMAMLALWV